MRIVKIICICAFCFSSIAQAQSVLTRAISLNVDKQKLGSVLNLMEEKGRFRFSYNSNILPIDSIVTIRESNLTLESLLDKLLNNRFEYRQSGNFVIIRYAPLELLLRVNEAIGNTDAYTISGQVVDKKTERPIADASIYEKNLLISEISDANGYFTMRLKNISQPISLTVNKENYKSTVTHFLAEVVISNKKDDINERFIFGNLDTIELTWLGRALITTKQKIQSVNIGGFISKAPVQFSLLPGLNSHGSLSGQVVNKFSLNAIGAYSAGVDGGEIGLVFNINKSDVRYFQFGGAFNLVGGNVFGTQVAGFFNYDFGSFKGFQTAIGYNRVGKDFEGFQVGGVYNQVNHDFTGMQVTVGLNVVGGNFKGFQVGAFNLVPRNVRGFQIGVGGNFVNGKSHAFQVGGIANINKEAEGVNLAVLSNITLGTSKALQLGLLNYASRLEGVQLGLINLSKDNDGYAIGLLNFSLKGYHKFSFTVNENALVNIAYKGGSKKLYSMLSVGRNVKLTDQINTIGLGFGREVSLWREKLSLNPEISSHYVYQGSWDYFNLLSKFELPINIRLSKWLALQTGPSVNIYYTDQHVKVGKFGLLRDGRTSFKFDDPNLKGWIGWNMGIVLF